MLVLFSMSFVSIEIGDMGCCRVSLIGAILNTITPSKKERMLWALVSIVLLICATYVAVS